MAFIHGYLLGGLLLAGLPVLLHLLMRQKPRHRMTTSRNSSMAAVI